MNATAGSQLIIFESEDRTVQVRLDGETVWLTQRQMAELFDTTPENVLMHLKGIYEAEELAEGSTAKDFLAVRTEGRRQVRRQLKHYNLDAIISVGYRVNSRRGVKFRQWANGVLRQHLTQGYTLNAQRLAQRGLAQAQEAVALMARTLQNQALVSDEGAAVLGVVQRYLSSFGLLLAYDEDRLPAQPIEPREPQPLLLEDARIAIDTLAGALAAKGEHTPLFGRERGGALAGLLGAIEQTMFGEPLYPSAQVRAAHVLYFVIKDHPFSDGNKRIGTLLFLEYLRRNGLLVRAGGEPRFADNAIVALALLIAESAPAQKDLMVRLTLALMGTD